MWMATLDDEFPEFDTLSPTCTFFLSIQLEKFFKFIFFILFHTESFDVNFKRSEINSSYRFWPSSANCRISFLASFETTADDTRLFNRVLSLNGLHPQCKLNQMLKFLRNCS